MSEPLTKMDKLALAKKKLKEFESKRLRECDQSLIHHMPSSEDTNGRHSVTSNHSSSGFGKLLFIVGNIMNKSIFIIITIENTHFNTFIGLGRPSDANGIFYQQSYSSDAGFYVNGSSISQSSSHSSSIPFSNNLLSQSPVPALLDGADTSSANLNGLSNANMQSSELEHERSRLIKERDSAIAAHEQVTTQLEQLHLHYSQLHAAYSQMSNSGVHSDAERQIQQLQSALSVIVEEKTTLQAELRSVRDALHREELINKESTDQLVNNETNDDTNELKGRLLDNERLLAARNNELEALRKEAAAAQAQLLTVQHERSEAQARLKVIAREKEAVESDLSLVRHELHMRGIYLKQLGAHETILTHQVDENALKDLKEQVRILEADIRRLRSERNQVRQEAEEKQILHESYRKEFSESLETLKMDLHSALSSRDVALARVRELEDQLSILMNDFTVVRKSPEAQNLGHIIPSATTTDETDKRLDEAVKKANSIWQTKLDEYTKRSEELLQKKMKLRLLEERTAESRASESNLLSLSEQLQNEKSTVSRAVAQNKELKEQLIETENRVISLTEEKLHSELARQKAEHQVKELTKRMELEKYSMSRFVIFNRIMIEGDASLNSAVVLEKVLHPALSIEPSESKDVCEEVNNGGNHCEIRGREMMLENQLELANKQLDEVRAELRRSHTQNEEMNQIIRQNAEDENQNSIHVELGQAIARVHELAAENEQLREKLMRASENRPLPNISSMDQNQDVNNPCSFNYEEYPNRDKPTNSSLSHTEVGSIEWAYSELEKRFSDAMRRNAELDEGMEKLEHINTQLQLENDTIADHVILYQHQRRLIRERLKSKDKQLAALETERIKTVERCHELQQILMEVLGRSGALKEYKIGHKPSARVKQRVSRSYSHSTVDEMSGDEDVIVDGTSVEVPNRSLLDMNISEQKNEEVCKSDVKEDCRLSSIIEDKDAAVKKILQIIADLSSPTHSTAHDKLHCTQCIGELQNL
uniref:GOLGA2L5 domain-containing protein n=1 Tax=Heterorhabditis bacteriophora TaxID=37862 RepID=A0A1I7XUU6_HETBA